MPEEKGTKVGMADHAQPIVRVGKSLTDTQSQPRYQRAAHCSVGSF